MFKSTELIAFIDEAAKYISASESASPRLDAENIIAFILRIPRLELMLSKNKEIDKRNIYKIESLVKRRCSNEPLQYILGKAYFRNLELEVGPGVLIPRPETELLTDLALELAPVKAGICDLGTGSGAIALSIAYERPDTNVIGCDISSSALKFAKKNKKNLGIKNVIFIKSDLFSSLKGSQFHLITANLPYISDKEFPNLPSEIRNFEPGSAFLGGEDGLDTINLVIQQAPDFLTAGGYLILEISPTQEKKVRKILIETGRYDNIEFKEDLNNLIRFCIARKSI